MLRKQNLEKYNFWGKKPRDVCIQFTIEISKQIASGNVKITPDLLVQGGDSIGGLLSAYLTQIISNKPDSNVK